MKSWSKDRRKYKRQGNYLHRKIRVGGYFVDCMGHPCICTEKNFYKSDMFGSDVSGNSLVDDRQGSSCSLLHCAPEPLTKKEAESISAPMREFLKHYSRVHPNEIARISYEPWGNRFYYSTGDAKNRNQFDCTLDELIQVVGQLVLTPGPDEINAS